MRTRMLRLTATAGATALLVGVGTLAAAGSASAATSAAASPAHVTVMTQHHHHDDECCWQWTPDGWEWGCERGWSDDGLLGGLITINIA